MPSRHTSRRMGSDCAKTATLFGPRSCVARGRIAPCQGDLDQPSELGKGKRIPYHLANVWHNRAAAVDVPVEYAKSAAPRRVERSLSDVRIRFVFTVCHRFLLAVSPYLILVQLITEPSQNRTGAAGASGSQPTPLTWHHFALFNRVNSRGSGDSDRRTAQPTTRIGDHEPKETQRPQCSNTGKKILDKNMQSEGEATRFSVFSIFLSHQSSCLFSVSTITGQKSLNDRHGAHTVNLQQAVVSCRSDRGGRCHK